MLFKLIIILLFLLVLYYRREFTRLIRRNKFFKTKKFIIFNKKNLNIWMNLTKKERYDLSKQDSIAYLDKRKVLLAEIRKEYKNISRENSEKKLKEK